MHTDFAKESQWNEGADPPPIHPARAPFNRDWRPLRNTLAYLWQKGLSQRAPQAPQPPLFQANKEETHHTERGTPTYRMRVVHWCCVFVFPNKTTSTTKQETETQQRALIIRTSCWVTISLFPFVSLSMKFQASRFSASGRRMPLEPRRSEACRSCQPMHVLSFGEGRR